MLTFITIGKNRLSSPICYILTEFQPLKTDESYFDTNIIRIAGCVNFKYFFSGGVLGQNKKNSIVPRSSRILTHNVCLVQIWAE